VQLSDGVGIWHAAPNTLRSRLLQGHAGHRTQGATAMFRYSKSLPPRALQFGLHKVESISKTLRG
jgi:hypothetical protein